MWGRVGLWFSVLAPFAVFLPAFLFVITNFGFAGPAFALLMWVVSMAWAILSIEVRRATGRTSIGVFHVALFVALGIHLDVLFLGCTQGKWRWWV